MATYAPWKYSCSRRLCYNNHMKPWAKQTGFTIVELLIVIVVIGILAAITIVAYNGIQGRAKDSQTDSALSQVKKVLEIYRADNGFYPACGTDNGGCGYTGLSTPLVPTYLSSLPGSPELMSYVRGTPESQSYAININYTIKADCKSGVNVNPGWWGTGIPTC